MADNRVLGAVGTKLLFENDRVKVWEMSLAPGEESDVHRHELDYVMVQVGGDRFTEVVSENARPEPAKRTLESNPHAEVGAITLPSYKMLEDEPGPGEAADVCVFAIRYEGADHESHLGASLWFKHPGCSYCHGAVELHPLGVWAPFRPGAVVNPLGVERLGFGGG